MSVCFRLGFFLLAFFPGLLFSFGGKANAATVWCNPANTFAEDGQSKQTGYATLWRALSHLSPGDTLIIANGDWSSNADMTIDSNGHLPVSGTAYNNMTTIQAETDWKVRLPAINDTGVGGVNYVRIQGIVFHGFSNLYQWNHIKLIRCGFFGSKLNGNNATLNLGGPYGGPGCTYVLVEDCIAWGGGRYNFLDFFGNYNIFRRCVVRHDWYIPGIDQPGGDTYNGQEASFRGYGSTNGLWQNCISIDSDRAEYYNPNQSEHADYWIGDQSGAGGNVVSGCISMKGHNQAYYFGGPDAGTGTVELNNSIALGPYTLGNQYLTGFSVVGNVQASFNNLLAYNIKNSFQHFVSNNWKTNGSLVFRNSIAVSVGSADFGNLDHINHFNDGGGSWGTNDLTYNPLLNGLLYPVRIENGSALERAGSGGSLIGPTIMKKIGISGTARDEAGYDMVTDENLWPFPNEDKIKELMSVTVPGVDGHYGFTTGNSLDNSPQTLTKYIWEYLGNQIPPEIYGNNIFVACNNDYDELNISKVKYVVVNGNQLKITFKTNNYSKGIVKFGIDRNLKEKKKESTNKKEHIINLKNLTPGIKYYFRILARDRHNQSKKTKIYSVTLPREVVSNSVAMKRITNFQTTVSIDQNKKGQNSTIQESDQNQLNENSNNNTNDPSSNANDNLISNSSLTISNSNSQTQTRKSSFKWWNPFTWWNTFVWWNPFTWF